VRFPDSEDLERQNDRSSWSVIQDWLHSYGSRISQQSFLLTQSTECFLTQWQSQQTVTGYHQNDATQRLTATVNLSLLGTSCHLLLHLQQYYCQTTTSAIAGGPHKVLCQLKSHRLLHRQQAQLSLCHLKSCELLHNCTKNSRLKRLGTDALSWRWSELPLSHISLPVSGL